MNFKDLSDPDGHNFLQALKQAPSHVTPDNHKRFFRMMLNFAAETIDAEIGEAILISVIESLASDATLQLFVSSGFPEQLPFANKLLTNRLFDILRILAIHAPRAFDGSVLLELPNLARTNPHKLLTILAFYSQSTRHTEVFRVIFDNSQLFTRRDCLPNLISLLIWLIENNQRFKAKFGADVAHVMSVIIHSTKGENAGYCYTALSHLIDSGVPVDEVPATCIVPHLSDDEARPAAISFMLRQTPKHGNLTQLVTTLVSLAQTDAKASFVLVKLARMGKVAQILINNPSWMTLGLPQRVHTLRLFCQVMTFTSLRTSLMENEEQIGSFFSGLLTLDDESITLIICSLIKRLPLTATFIESLSERGFINAYFSIVRKYGYATQGLLLLNQLALAGYCRDYDTLIDYVIENIQSPSHCSAGLKAATTLCRYPKCKRRFIARRVPEYVRESRRRGQLVDSFLAAVEE